MRVIVVGVGEVGRHICQQLSAEGHDVILIDRNADRLKRVERDLNMLCIEGNGASAEILEQANISKADLFIAVTDIDEVNLIACIMAKEYGVLRRVARVRNEEYFSGASPLNEHQLGIDLLINPDQVMAEEILRISKMSEAFEVVDFAHGEVILVGYQVKEGNPICNITLADLKDLRGLYDFVIVAIVREGQTIVPRGSDIIQAEDRIYLVVRRTDMAAVEDLFNLWSTAPKRAFIIGGGQVGFRVAKAMEKQKVDVALVEADSMRCEYLAEHLNSAVVLNFDGLDARDLLSEGVDTTDLVVAVTNEDTTNILSSLLAKYHGAKKCITRISRPDFIPLLGKLGIDVALSPRLVAANMILRFVRRGAIISVATLLGSEAEVVELVVPERWSHADKPLGSIGFPEDTNLGAVVRQGKVIIPSGDTVLETGDRLIIFSMKKAIPMVEQFLAS
nr:Trk system potassium transporter TrkA [Deltaproteobacteria bacterium]